MKIITHTILYSFLILALVPFFVQAQRSTELKEPTGPGTSEKDPFVTCGYDDKECTLADLVGPGGLVQRGLNWIFMFAGFIVAIMFMYAGFLLISAGGDSGQIKRAKDVFKNVVIGFVIMLVAVVAIQQLLKYLGAAEFFQNIIIK